MSKQDRQGVRTAADLERKYNLGGNPKGGSETEQMSKFVQELSEQKIKLERHSKNESVHTSEEEKAKIKNKVDNTAEFYGDINNLLTSGFYRVGTNANLPDTCQYGQIIVSRGSDTASQLAFSYYTGRMFTRSCNITNGTANWTKWHDFATEEDLADYCGVDIDYSQIEFDTEELVIPGVGNRNIVSDAYSEETSYAIGDYCIYKNVLYKCTAETTGAFDVACWETTTVAEEIETLNAKMVKSVTVSGTTNSNGNIATDLNTSEKTIISAYTASMYQSKNLICTTLVSDGIWYLHFTLSDGTIVKACSVECIILYVDKS